MHRIGRIPTASRSSRSRLLGAGVVLVLLLHLSVAAAQTEADAGEGDALQDLRATIDLSPDSLTIGDPFTARFTVRTDAATQVRFAPELKLGNAVQILDFEEQPPRSVEGSDERIWQASYTLALYAVGEHMLAPFRAQVQRGSTTAEVATDSVFVFVASVLDDSLAAADLLDIKQQRHLAVPLPLWVWIALGALALAALLGWLWWRRRHRRPEEVVVTPPKPAHEVALQALARLEQKRLPLDGRTKEHYIQLSEILRSYLEAAPAFGIPALEETTDEIVRSLQNHGTAAERVQHVQLLCEESDLVKFAKHEPPVDECMEAIERVADFVRRTAKHEPAPVVADASVLAALDAATRDATSTSGTPTPGARP